MDAIDASLEAGGVAMVNSWGAALLDLERASIGGTMPGGGGGGGCPEDPVTIASSMGFAFVF